MAVAETSRSSGKSSASGATRSTRSQRTRCPRRVEIQASNWPLVPVEIAQVATNSLAIATVKASNVLAAALQAGYDAYKSMSRGTNVQAKDIVIQATQGDITATAAKLQTDNITLDAAKKRQPDRGRQPGNQHQQ